MSHKMTLISNIGNGQQIQVTKDVESQTDAWAFADWMVDVGARQIARTNLPIVEAKIETLVAQIAANEEVAKLIEQEINIKSAGARKTASGKVINMDEAQITNLRQTLFQQNVKKAEFQAQLDLAKIELAKTKLAAGVL